MRETEREREKQGERERAGERERERGERLFVSAKHCDALTKHCAHPSGVNGGRVALQAAKRLAV